MSDASPKIYLVVAVASNGVIGRDGKLPWHLPEDLKHFKRLTLGHPVIMGRRTWESLKGPLPGRDNIVVTGRAGYDAPGAAVANSLEAALALCTGEPVAFVIGGSRLFADSLPIAAGIARAGNGSVTMILESLFALSRNPASAAVIGTDFRRVWCACHSNALQISVR